MAFVRIRMIKGKPYRYHEERWREGGKVRSRSISLGPVGSGGAPGWLRLQLGITHGLDWDAIEREENVRLGIEAQRHASHLGNLYLDFGLKLGPATPVAVEKPTTAVDLPSAVGGEKEASPDGEAMDVSGTQDQ